MGIAVAIKAAIFKVINVVNANVVVLICNAACRKHHPMHEKNFPQLIRALCAQKRAISW